MTSLFIDRRGVQLELESGAIVFRENNDPKSGSWEWAWRRCPLIPGPSPGGGRVKFPSPSGRGGRGEGTRVVADVAAHFTSSTAVSRIKGVEVRLTQAIHRQTVWVVLAVGGVTGLIRWLDVLLK